MKIYGKNKQLILDVEVDDSSYRHHVVLGEHNLMLRYSLAEHVEIPVGAYCVFQGETYTLERPESFKMQHRRAFEYSVLMEAAQYKAKIWKFVNPIDGRIKFSLTARPREHLQMLVDNLNEREPERWTIGKCLDDVERVITYDNAYCWDAISQMAEEFGTEFEFRGREVSLRKVEYNTNNPLPLSYGKGNGIKPGTSRSNPTEQTISKLYVQGGERNIDRSKYEASQLHLPKGGRIAFDGDKFEGDEGFNKSLARTYVADNKGYSIRRSDIPQVLGAEDSFDCSYIYPSRVGSVSEVVVANKDKHFYDIIDNTIPLLLNYASCVIAGETLSIVFQSGMLAGKEFEVKYINAAGGGKKGQRFEIVPQEIDGQTMPNETFAPRVGDKYAVFHCMLPSSYIRDDKNKLGAEWNMMRQAVRYLYNRENEGYVYSLSVDEIWAKRNWTQLQGRIILGGMILFSDESFQVQGVRLRITGIKDYINAPNKIEIELSDNLVRGSLSQKIQRIDDSKWSKVDDGYRRSFLDLIRDIQSSQVTLKALMSVFRLPLPDSARLALSEELLQRYKETLNSDIKGSEAYLNLDRQVDLKEDKSNAKTKYEQLDSEIHKRVLREFFDRKIAEYVPTSEFLNRINGLVPLKDFADLRTIVNNEISSWTIDRIPSVVDRDIQAATIQSYNAEPYNSWGAVGGDRNLDAHVGDTWLVNKEGAVENGKMYRFIKGSKPNTYRWAKMSDSPAIVALQETQRLNDVVNDTKIEFLARLPEKVTAEFNARKNELKGENGKDAAPIRPNLLKGYIDRVVTLEARNNGTGSDNYNYNWLVGPMWLKDGQAYVVSADFEWVSGEKPDGVSLLMYKRDNNHLYSHLSLNGRTKARVSIYIPADIHNTVGIAGYAGRAGKTRGVAAKYSNIKLEEVQEGEPKEASAYLPHTDDLKVPLSSVIQDLKEQGISNEVKELLKADNKFVKATKGEKGDDGKTPKVALGEDRHLYVDGVRQMYSLKGEPGAPGKSVTVSDLNIGWDGTSLVVDGQKSPSLKGEPGVSPSALAVANEINTASFREGLSNVVVTKVTTNQDNLARIRRGMVVETKYNEDRGKIIKRVDDVEKEIVPFAFVEVGTYSSEWRDYTGTENAGGTITPDPWGGIGDLHIRTTHNYELYRSMQNLPPKYIEQSKKVLKTGEYKVGEKWHRDVSATIVYDAQEIQGIEEGSARCWEIFTSPHVDSLLRYGKNTRIANPNMQGQQQGSGANAYWNVYIEKGANYRIFVSNDGNGKYKLYVIKNGAY